MRVLGLSSGTSHDGIDAALVSFTRTPDGGELRARLLHHATTPYEPGLRAAIREALPPGKVGLGAVCALDTRLGQAFAGTATAVLDAAGPADLVCSHGQTVFHAATEGTLQLGQPAWIAERTGLPVVADVRVRDVAAGGQGAPLVPVLDLMLLAGRAGRARGRGQPRRHRQPDGRGAGRRDGVRHRAGQRADRRRGARGDR